MSQKYDIMRVIRIHKAVERELINLEYSARKRLSEAITTLAMGMKTEQTPKQEIETAKRRLREMQ